MHFQTHCNFKKLKIEFNHHLEDNEILAINLVKNRTNIPVPDILFYGRCNNKNIIIIKEIEGETLDKVWINLTNEEKSVIKNQVIKYIKQCHSITSETIGSLALKGKSLLPQFEYKIFEQYIGLSPYYFNHLDLDKSNIIVNGHLVTGIIDWEYSGFYPNIVAKEIHRTKQGDDWKTLYDNLVEDN